MELDLEPSAKIKDVHDKIVARFYNDHDPVDHPGIFEIMDDGSQLTGFKYEYTDESELPPDATQSRAERDEDRIRTLSETGDRKEMRVWQYYVSAIMEKAGSNRIIIARDPEQRDPRPSYATTSLNKGLPTQVLEDCGFQVSAYNLTWRLLTINLNDGAAQMKASRRRQRTSGRIV